jgi:hypothetical protein
MEQKQVETKQSNVTTLEDIEKKSIRQIWKLNLVKFV